MHRFSARRPFFLLAAIILLVFLCYLTVADELLTKLESDSEKSEFSDFVENLVTSKTIPAAQTVGFGITVVRSNSSTPFYWKGFGYRDKENKLPVDEHTLFPVGSITKSFVGVLVVKILSEKFPQYGENVLEMPVKKLIGSNSKLNWTLSDRFRSDTISFKDLLAHRSCTTNYVTLSVQYGAVNDPAEYIYRTRYEQEECPFRTKFVYNNAMYTLAGHLIAEIAGQTFDLLMENFLLELGMTSSNLSKIDADYNNMPNFTQAYYFNENQTIVKGNGNLFRQVSVINPAGGLISTLNDMSKYISFHLNRGTVDGKEILSKDKHQWLTRNSAPPGASYGLGLALTPIPGEKEPALVHNGYWTPYTGHMSIFPSLGVSIFTASSGPGYAKPIDAATLLHNEIFAYFSNKKNGALNEVPAKSIQNASEKDLDKNANKKAPDQKTVNSQDLKRKVGLRLDPSQAVGKYGAGIGELEVSFNNKTKKTLQLTYGLWGQADLEPLPNSTSYKIKWTSDIVMVHQTMSDYSNILEFTTPDMVALRFVSGTYFLFARNLTLADLPEIPWEQDKCEVNTGTTLWLSTVLTVLCTLYALKPISNQLHN